jgi:hypothetical protein
LEINAQLELTDALLGYVGNQNSYQTLPSNLGLNNPSATTNISSYNQLVLERNKLLQSATPKTRLLLILQSRSIILELLLFRVYRKIRTGLQLAKNGLSSEQNSISGKISKVPVQENFSEALKDNSR